MVVRDVKGLELNRKAVKELFDGVMWGMRLHELVDAFRGLVPPGHELRHISFDIKNKGVVVLYSEEVKDGNVHDTPAGHGAEAHG